MSSEYDFYFTEQGIESLKEILTDSEVDEFVAKVETPHRFDEYPFAYARLHRSNPALDSLMINMEQMVESGLVVMEKARDWN